MSNQSWEILPIIMFPLRFFLTFSCALSLFGNYAQSAAVDSVLAKRAVTCSTLVATYKTQTLVPGDTEYPAQREAHW
jgi:hypothetical protein